MKFLPTLTEAKRIAATGKYDVLPVSCEMLSDFITPIETMRILQNVSTHCYMLESAQANEAWGRYTFLGYDPKLEISCVDGEMKIGNLVVKTDNPSEYIRQILSGYKSPSFDYLPSFTGGLVGYFSYDYLGYKEPAVRCEVEDSDAFKDVDLMLFDKVIAFDNLCQKIILIVNMSLEDAETGYNKAIVELKQLRELLLHGEKKQNMGGKLLGEVTPLFDKKRYCDMVEQAKIPILGVCLGHQAICAAFGATVTYAKELMHGKQSEVEFDTNCLLFDQCPSLASVARYHSLAAAADTLPECLKITARTRDGEVMAVQHREYPVYGVQFHPESIMTLDGKQMLKNFIEAIHIIKGGMGI